VRQISNTDLSNPFLYSQELRSDPNPLKSAVHWCHHLVDNNGAQARIRTRASVPEKTNDKPQSAMYSYSMTSDILNNIFAGLHGQR